MAVGDPASCTTETCPVPDGFLRSPPLVAASIPFLAAFAILVPLNLFTGLRYRTVAFSGTLTLGLLLEVMGYAGRFLLESDVSNRRNFALYFLGTTTAPAFMAASIYLTLPHILVVYGKQVRLPWRPVHLGVGFLAIDTFTVALQAVGSAFAANGSSKVEVGRASFATISQGSFSLSFLSDESRHEHTDCRDWDPGRRPPHLLRYPLLVLRKVDGKSTSHRRRTPVCRGSPDFALQNLPALYVLSVVEALTAPKQALTPRLGSSPSCCRASPRPHSLPACPSQPRP